MLPSNAWSIGATAGSIGSARLVVGRPPFCAQLRRAVERSRARGRLALVLLDNLGIHTPRGSRLPFNIQQGGVLTAVALRGSGQGEFDGAVGATRVGQPVEQQDSCHKPDEADGRFEGTFLKRSRRRATVEHEPH